MAWHKIYIRQNGTPFSFTLYPSNNLGITKSKIDTSILNMHVIGVAGASGGVGKAIVERLAQEPKYQVIAFSRSVRRIQCLASVQELLLIS